MSTGAFCLFVLSVAFLAGLQCASQKSSMGIGVTLPSTALAASGEASGKKDANQTQDSRRRRKNLSVDFAVPSLLRNYLSEFIKRPLNGDCQHADGCYTVRANLRMQCVPLQKTISSLLETKLSAADSPDNVSAAGQLPYRNKRPLSRVLNFVDSKKSHQVLREIGEESVRTGCGGLSVDGDPPQATLEIDLTHILEWWLGAGGGRLRVRLIPEKRAQVPGREEKYSAAIRAADPRLFLQIASSGEKRSFSLLRIY